MGRLAGTLFFGIFALAGIGFTAGMAVMVLNNLSTRSWAATPCVIESITHRISETDGPYTLDVRYTYEVAGQTYVGTSVDLDGNPTTSDFREIQRLLVAFPAGPEPATCYVDPAEPSRAVLRQAATWEAASVLFPLIFVLVGVGGLWFVWKKPAVPTTDAAISARKSDARTGARIGRTLGAVFFLVGIIALYPLAIAPLWRLASAQAWPETPAVVERSELVTHTDSDGTTYSVDILYRYDVAGQTYRSNWYGFFGGSSSGRQSKLDVLDAHPVGGEVTCYVNPADPTMAVLHRGWSWIMLLGLIPVAFVLVGAGVFVGTSRSLRASRPGAELFPSASAAETAGDSPTGGVTLTAGKSRVGKVAFLALFSLVWNGISWTMLLLAYREGEACGMAFLGLFCLIGLVVISATVHQALALLNPQVLVTLPSRHVALGEGITLEWQLVGSASRITKLTISVVGEEYATYRRGTDTTTDRNTFRTIELLSTTDLGVIAAGRGRTVLAMPVDTMHSFKARRNEIRWTLKVHGAISNWPDMNDEWQLEVMPVRGGVANAEAQA